MNMCSDKCKKFYIISLCPIPNVLILFYYILSLKILVETSHITECQGIWIYSLLTFLHIITIHIYLVSQLFLDRQNIMNYTHNYQFMIQIIIYILLYMAVIVGGYIINENKNCRTNSNLLQSYGWMNFVFHTIILVSINGFLMYSGWISHLHKIKPITDKDCSNL